ncbi:MAG: glycosyltransferase family 4 protein [Dermatophilaceae bacterium]|nr:glycosyltransferase [Intrasporangiaceae bacterium]
MSRVRGLLTAAVAAVRLAADDPVWLTVQAGHRLPGPVRSRVGSAAVRHGRRPALRAWGHLLEGDVRSARGSLDPVPTGSALDASLRVHAGLPPDIRRSPAATVRSAWLTGDLDLLARVSDDPAAPPRSRAIAHDHLDLLTARPRPLPRGPAPAAVTSDLRSPGAARHRVVHVLTNSTPWTHSGYTMRTHAILTAQRRHDIDVVAITRPGYPASVGRPWFRPADVIDDVTYVRSAPLRPPRTEAERVDLWAEDIVRLAARHGATHLHATTHYVNALATEAAAGALGLPWIYEVRGQLERTWAAGRAAAGDPEPLSSARYARWRAAEAAVASRADAVVTISEAMADDLIARGVDSRRITLAPNCIDASLLEISTAPREARTVVGLPADGFWVGAVTSVVHYEGLTVLAEAIARARAAGHDVRGAIVGDGVAFPSLASRVAELGLEDLVLLPGRMPQPVAQQWLQALDVVAIPRQNVAVTQHVPPLKLIEALGVGRPAIVSDLPAITEVVRDGVSAVVVPPGDAAALAAAIIRLASDPDLRTHLCDAGRQAAEPRTWDALAGVYARIYAEVARR